MEEYDCIWNFVADYYPNYSSADEILENDILQRLDDNETVDQEDIDRLSEGKPECMDLDSWWSYRLVTTSAIIYELAMAEYIRGDEPRPY
jgi:hypothetical protein